MGFGNIFVEGHTPAAFQSYVQRQVISQPLPLSHLSSGEQKLGSQIWKELGSVLATSSYLGSWGMLQSTPVLDIA